MSEPQHMWQCQIANCGYIYDPDRGDKRATIPAGILFENLPEDWHCPVCKSSKKAFKCLGDAN